MIEKFRNLIVGSVIGRVDIDSCEIEIFEVIHIEYSSTVECMLIGFKEVNNLIYRHGPYGTMLFISKLEKNSTLIKRSLKRCAWTCDIENRVKLAEGMYKSKLKKLVKITQAIKEIKGE